MALWSFSTGGRTPARVRCSPSIGGCLCAAETRRLCGFATWPDRNLSRAPRFSLSRSRARGARAGFRSSSRTALVCACDHVDGAEPDIQRGADRGPPRAAGHPQRLFQGGDPRQPQGPPRLLRRVFPENGGHPRWCVPRGARRRAHTARADDTTPATQTRSPDPSSQTTRKRSRGLVYRYGGGAGIASRRYAAELDEISERRCRPARGVGGGRRRRAQKLVYVAEPKTSIIIKKIHTQKRTHGHGRLTLRCTRRARIRPRAHRRRCRQLWSVRARPLGE